jgi:phosphatidylserine decarboxylase
MKIQIHKEGRKIVLFTLFLLVFLYILHNRLFTNALVSSALAIVFLAILVFVLRFFRVPERSATEKENLLFSAADGKIVAIEEVVENEYFNDKRIQVSVFMSVWDVHINWFPIKSEVKYFKYHPGKYLIARHPKSSELNERTSIVIETPSSIEILIRQIAGYIARRVICYAENGKLYNAGEELGFIKFGSRVDFFLPLNTEILVKPGDRVKGLVHPIALLKKN